MSAGYASRLSEYKNKGVCGLVERVDNKRVLNGKLKKLSEWVSTSKHLVVLTGAGISTGAGANIPDFRGPKGIWTLEKQQKKSGEGNGQSNKKRKLSESKCEPVMDFSTAKPTLTHRAITKLASAGILNYCITQNVDGLHRRSGLSRDYHCSLHGCVFTETCNICGTEYFGDKDVGGMSFKPTGNLCTKENCDGKLHDTLLDWEDPLPEDDFERAERECTQADLLICLGTSLRIQPVGRLPLCAKRFVIVNLQETPLDNDAAIVIRARVDDVMDDLLQRMGYSNWKSESPPPIERQWSRREKEQA